MSVRRLNPEQPAEFALTDENMDWAKAQIAKYPAGREASAVIPILWRAQEQHEGWLPEPAIRYVAEMLAMPYIRVLEVATFYTMFQLAPVGRKAHVQVCGTTPCMLRGSEDLIGVCKRKIAAHANEVSKDGDFSWEEVECLGACSNAPMVQIFKDVYEDLDADTFETLLDDIAAGRPVVPGPVTDRRFAGPEGGLTSLTEIDDDTAGDDPLPQVVAGAGPASLVVAGASINGGDGGAPMNGGVDADGAPILTVVGSRPAAAKATASKRSARKTVANNSVVAQPSKAKVSTAKGKSGSGTLKPGSADNVAVTKSDAAMSAPAASGHDLATGPERLDAPRGGKADDLKRIKGLGPKIEASLNELGIYHFDQIGGWSADDILWLDEKLKLRARLERDDWTAQARALANAKKG